MPRAGYSPHTMKKWYNLALQLDSQTDGDGYRGSRDHNPNAMDINTVQATDKKT